MHIPQEKPIHWIASTAGVMLAYGILLGGIIGGTGAIDYLISIALWVVILCAVFIPMERYDRKKYGN